MTDYSGIAAHYENAEAAGEKRDLVVESGLPGLPVGSDVMDVAACLRRLASQLNGVDALGREVIRARAIKEVERVGVSPAARIVDAALPRETTKDDRSSSQGAAISFQDVEPWPDPVDLAQVLSELVQSFTRHVALPEGAATAAALWVLFAHAHDAFGVSPLLAITSPEKRCGKTTLLELLGALVPRPLPAANITAAALFRAVERYGPTLLVDEADTFLARSDELRGVLNSGHRRRSAYVVRTTGEDFEPRTFGTWCPKAIASIGSLPDTLGDRAIILQMRRRRPDESVTPLRLDRMAAVDPLRRRAARWSVDYLDTLRGADPQMPSELHDRAGDNWRPLLAIADLAAGHWPQAARQAAVLLTANSASDEDAPRVTLLTDLRDLFSSSPTDRLSTADILAYLHGLETRRWPEWRHGQPLSARQLARLLAPFGIAPRTVRDGAERWKGYRKEQFADAWVRYLPSDPCRSDNPMAAGVSADQRAVTDSELSRFPSLRNVAALSQCHGVTDERDVAIAEGGDAGPGLEVPDAAWWDSAASEEASALRSGGGD